MNLIPDIAETLGAEVGEKFYVRDKKGRYYTVGGKKIPFYFNDHALRGLDIASCNAVLRCLLNGEYEIVKKWKPKQGDTYWRVLKYGITAATCWDGDIVDYTHYAAGNCFKTEQEAIENSERIVRKLRNKYEEDL